MPLLLKMTHGQRKTENTKQDKNYHIYSWQAEGQAKAKTRPGWFYIHYRAALGVIRQKRATKSSDVVMMHFRDHMYKPGI